MLMIASVNKTPEDESTMIPVFIFVINFRNEADVNEKVIGVMKVVGIFKKM